MACLQRWNYCSVTVPMRHFVMQRARPPWTWQILNSQRLGRCCRNILSAANARFMSEDPKLFDAGDYNLFRYCHNDPIDFTDPMGLADERREPWHNHQEQAKQLGKLQAPTESETVARLRGDQRRRPAIRFYPVATGHGNWSAHGSRSPHHSPDR